MLYYVSLSKWRLQNVLGEKPEQKLLATPFSSLAIKYNTNV